MTIASATVVLVGAGLCGDVPIADVDGADACNYDTERTATYRNSDGTVEPVSIDPQPG